MTLAPGLVLALVAGVAALVAAAPFARSVMAHDPGGEQIRHVGHLIA